MNFIGSQTIVSIFGYLLVFVSIGRALWHQLTVQDLARQLQREREHLNSILQNTFGSKSIRNLRHPFARVILAIRNNLNLQAQAVELLETESQSLLLPFVSRSQGNQGQAVFFGFMGTLIGILCGALAYKGSNTGLLLQNIGLAMITTMIGGIAAEIEAATVRKLEMIHLSLMTERPEDVDRLRTLTFELTPVPVSPETPRAPRASKPQECLDLAVVAHR